MLISGWFSIPLPQPKNALTFAKENSSLPKTIIKRLLAVTLVTLRKKILHYSSPHWIIQTRQPNKSTGCPGNCFLDNQEDRGGRRAGEMSEQQCYIKEAKAPLAWLSRFPNLYQAAQQGTKKALCYMRKVAAGNVKTHILPSG